MFEVQDKDGVVLATYESFDAANAHAQQLNAKSDGSMYYGVWSEDEDEDEGDEWWELDDAQEAAEQHYRDLTTY